MCRKFRYILMRQHVSISKWVAEQIPSRVEPIYPKDFEKLFGSIPDQSFSRPKETSFTMDSSYNFV